MCERANLVGEIDELGAQAAHTPLELPVAIVRECSQFIQRLPEQRDPLDHIIVQLAGNARALFLLRGEQLAAE